ncbi:MAG TPA: YicC/YloC family endoribonuclease [Caulobacteraceae bacterium]|nr:YicC/YloC family endoribonuclease [Caulobacteraceae bacterium]
MSLASMTGFARVEGALGDWTWAVEARSVNGRNLDLRFRAPAGLDALERPAREAAQSRFQRGQINIAVQGRRASVSRAGRINLEALESYLAFGEALVAAGRAAPPSLDGLLALPGVIEAADPDEDGAARAAVESAMAASIAEAMDALKRSRGAEGEAIEALLSGFLDRIETLTRSADVEAGQQPALIKARFERRLVELLGEGAPEDRIMQEAAAMAVRADVREEIDRLLGHVAAARALIAEDGASGRRLDFLTQEFMREANTLCSKSAVASLTTIGLALKASIDQFREQVQNVE